MQYCSIRHHGSFDVHPNIDQLTELLRGTRKPDIGSLNIGIEGSTKRKIVAYSPESREIDGLIEIEHKRRDVPEANVLNSPVTTACGCCDEAGGLSMRTTVSGSVMGMSPISSTTLVTAMIPWPHIVLQPSL